MDENDIIDRINEAYKEGFRDGFEYGSGKRSPYYGGDKLVEAESNANDGYAKADAGNTA